MNEQLYLAWIDALESGDYIHTRYHLRNGNAFCCLGVICNLVNPDSWTPIEKNYSPHKYPDIDAKSGFNGKSLPAQIMRLLNFRNQEGSFNLEELSLELRVEILSKMHHLSGTHTSLMAINDEIDNDPFSIIAKVLRERPPSLFHEVNDEQLTI